MKPPLDRDNIAHYEPLFEICYWIAAAGCFALVHLPGIVANRHVVYWMAMALVPSAFIWYHMLPRSWIGFRKTFYGAVSSVAFVTAFLSITGGVNSPFGLLYLLPILASFLILDTLRSLVVYGLILVGWGVLYFVDGLRNPSVLYALAPQVLIQVFAMSLGMVFTALFSRQLHRVILRERSISEQLQQSQTHLRAAADQLAQANKELHRISRVKDDFVAMVNHDLRTPLTAMKQASSLFLKDRLGPLTLDQREYMTLMARNLNRLTELITNLLDLSKLQAGKLKLDIQPCRIHDVAEETMHIHQPLIGQRTVHVDIAQALPPVMADRNRLIQILSNLVSNAVKFTAEGGTITVRAAASNGMMRIRVEDTGSGIPVEKHDRLFQRYDRLDVADPTRPGTGLGLAICRELVELQHGTIEVDSHVSGGTAFIVQLPVASVTEAVHG